ncbi:MAG: BON domain-containing protein [Thermoguttaceae bacterium]
MRLLSGGFLQDLAPRPIHNLFPPLHRMPMIASSTTERTTDHELLRAARKRLNNAFHPSIRKLACHCDEKGTLYLRGRLSSYYQKQLAQEAVSDLPGVVEIVNQAEVAAAAWAAPPLA